VLKKDLDQQFAEARSRVMDSVISKKYIEPILHSPKGFKIRTVDVKGDLSSDDHSVPHMEIFTEDSAILIDSIHGASHPHKANIEVKVESDSSHDLLYRGVKMFITRVKDENGNPDVFEKHVLPGDTAMLKKFFAENLQKENLGVKTVWVSKHPVTNLPPAQFYYESDFLEKPYGAVVRDYNGFIMGKIFPQILFGLLLLLVTSAAFIFSFRSLRNQLRLSAMKDDFISNVSHELKTPVATVKVALEALKEMSPAEKEQKMNDYLGMATQEMNRLESLVNKVMNGVLMENGKQVFEFENTNLKSLIDQALKSLQWQLQLHHASVHFTSDSEEIVVNADSTNVLGIFANLIDNSLKYGKDAPEILIHLSQTTSDAVVTFSDNGPGIPEEYLDKVFEKFFRIPSDDHHDVKGYGLGLSYVAQVMKEHKGSVALRNLASGGCEFTLRFPKG